MTATLVRRCLAGHLTDAPLDEHGYVWCDKCGYASTPMETYRLVPRQR